MIHIPLEWRVGHTQNHLGEPKEFVAATVPGAVQIDWAKAFDMPDWNRDVNFKEYGWMEDCFWVYKADIPKTVIDRESELLFRCGGIDYQYEIYFNRDKIYEYEGMFRPFELDLSKAADTGGELTIVIFPIPKIECDEKGTRVEASASCKPPVSYSWDWHPRLVPSGIWDETYLCVAKKERIARAEVRYSLSDDLSRASIYVDAEIKGYADAETNGSAGAQTNVSAGAEFDGNAVAQNDGGTENPGTAPARLRFRIYERNGSMAAEATDLRAPIVLTKPELWWCNGYGDPVLYSWELLLEKDGRVIDKVEGKTGFRKISMEMNAGAWDEPETFPKTRSPAPITITLNDTPIFAKGTNWVNPEIFPGVMNADTYLPLLKYAKDANMNLLRVWGGGIVNKDSFFDICDEFGLMVWQEFPLACNKYPDDDKYLATLESEARAIIRRLRSRACHAMWCGGNELFNNWSLMTDQSLPLRLLNKLCYELDRGKPFLPTSPVFGMAHGCYLFVYPDGREVYEVMPKAHHTAYTEFGVPSISNLKTCLDATTSDKIFPFVKNEVTTAHHAYDSWNDEDTWVSMKMLRGYFGEPESIEQLIEWSQWTQSEGYKCIYEEARRQKPYCSMALNWCYNEPWPTIANNSLLNYPADPKPAYGAVAQSCKGRLASARIIKFSWSSGERFSADLFLLNDGRLSIPEGSVKITAYCDGERVYTGKWDHPEVPMNQNYKGPVINFTISKKADAGGGGNGRKHGVLRLSLEAGDMSNEYKLLLRY